MGILYTFRLRRVAAMAFFCLVLQCFIYSPAWAEDKAPAIANRDALLFYQAQYQKQPDNMDVARRYALELADATADLTERGDMGAAMRLLSTLARLQTSHPEDLDLAQARAVALYNCLRGHAMTGDDAIEAYLHELFALQAAFPSDAILLQALSSGLRIQCSAAMHDANATRLQRALQQLADLQQGHPDNLPLALQYAKSLHLAASVLPVANAGPALQALTAMQKQFPRSGELDALIKDAYAHHLSIQGMDAPQPQASAAATASCSTQHPVSLTNTAASP